MRFRLPALCGALIAACQPAVIIDEDAPEEGDELRRGDVTTSMPQVGELRLPITDEPGRTATCTGTMVASQVVLTAAHCVDYRDEDFDYDSGAFMIHSSVSSETFTHHIVGYRSFGTGIGDADLALLHLREPITGLTPLPLRADEPADGEPATIYGYGTNDCSPSRASGDLDGNKRRYDFTWGNDPHAICAGDSGGPTLTAGEVAQVTSYKLNFLFTDSTGFGHVWNHYEDLEKQLEAWR